MENADRLPLPIIYSIIKRRSCAALAPAPRLWLVDGGGPAQRGAPPVARRQPWTQPGLESLDGGACIDRTVTSDFYRSRLVIRRFGVASLLHYRRRQDVREFWKYSLNSTLKTLRTRFALHFLPVFDLSRYWCLLLAAVTHGENDFVASTKRFVR